jgi:glycosyltransferase involved in cell wall biosynthesis
MKKIAILTPQFYDYTGSYKHNGGSEKLLIDYVNLLKDMGYYIELFQCGCKVFKKEYNGVKITAINAMYDIHIDSFPTLLNLFHEFTSDYDYYVYWVFTLPYNNTTVKPNISISHGIWHDYYNPNYHIPQWMEYMNNCLSGSQNIVSVDYNTIKWCQSTFPLQSSKFTCIPNYVDTSKFKPNVNKNKNKFQILFPRRLCEARGLTIAKQLAEYFTNKYKDIEFYFVGGSVPEIERDFSIWIQNKERIKWNMFSSDEMPDAYLEADLSIFPTTFSEGLSLSCLESLSCRVPCVVSHVGGLNEAIINNYNSLVCKPTFEDFKENIEYLYNNKSILYKFASRCREITLGFDIERWKHKWKKYISEVFPND